MSKTYKLIRPKSLNDSNYEQFEYLIRWIGRDGAEYIYMFYDAVLQNSVRNQIINSEDEDLIESLPEKEERSLTVTANDLSLNDLNVILEMFSNKFVVRLKKDGTTERLVPKSNSSNRRLRDGRYDIKIELRPYDLKVWS